jgi:hypothetical protein
MRWPYSCLHKQCQHLPRLIFAAFISLAGVDVGLDFEVIEHSDEDCRASCAKNQFQKLITPIMLPPPHFNILSLHITCLASSRTWFWGYWALWKQWSSQSCTKKSNSEVDHQGYAGPPTVMNLDGSNIASSKESGQLQWAGSTLK